MSNNLRSNKLVLDAVATVDAGIKSIPFYLGPATNVIVFIKNTSANSATVTLQAAALSANSSGVNAISGLQDSDWYTLYNRGNETATTIAVAANSSFAYDLSPVAVAAVRFFAVPTTLGSQATLTAVVESNG